MCYFQPDNDNNSINSSAFYLTYNSFLFYLNVLFPTTTTRGNNEENENFCPSFTLAKQSRIFKVSICTANPFAFFFLPIQFNIKQNDVSNKSDTIKSKWGKREKVYGRIFHLLFYIRKTELN